MIQAKLKPSMAEEEEDAATGNTVSSEEAPGRLRCAAHGLRRFLKPAHFAIARYT